MKFYVSLGLVLAGLVHSQQLSSAKLEVDSFLRETQHLKPTVKLVSTKQNGPISTVTYQDGPMNMKYQVRTDKNDMKIIGIEQTVSLSSNFQYQPVTVQQLPQNPIDMKLPPLPLIMPQFTIHPNGKVTSKNVFQQIGKQMQEMHKRMEQDRINFHQIMEQNRLQMRQRFRQNFQTAIKETPLLGSDDHDYNKATKIQTDQPLIGGEHDYNWATQTQDNHPIIGGDHDYTWMAVEIQPNQPLLGADDHEFQPEFIPQSRLIGGGEHDNWFQTPIQFDYPLIGGDDHDDWKETQKNHHKKTRQNHNGKGNHDNSKRHFKKRQDREQRHHSTKAWMNRQFNTDEVAPFLNEKLPDLMKNSQIVSVKNNSFEKGRGFALDIQLQKNDGNTQIISAFFKPRKQEFLIDKISTLQTTDSENILPIELAVDQKPAKKEIPAQNLVAPKFIQENEQPSLLGGKQDPEQALEFINLVKEIEFTQNNHISHEREEQIIKIPLLGGEDDIDHKIEKVQLVGGESDPDHLQKPVQKTEEKTEPVFDVTRLPLTGENDVNNHLQLELESVEPKVQQDLKQGLDLIEKAIKIVADISEQEIEDINETDEKIQSKDESKPQKLQHLIQ